MHIQKKDVWVEFIEAMVEANGREHRKTKEFELWNEKRNEIDKYLENNLTRDQKVVVEEAMVEIGCMSDFDGIRLYEQGMKDCVVLLRRLGVV